MVDPYGDTGKYTGQVQNDKPHGKGTMKYDDGRVYVGTYQLHVSSLCAHKILLTYAWFSRCGISSLLFDFLYIFFAF